VVIPSGRARLAPKPAPTGSEAYTITMGKVRVSRWMRPRGGDCLKASMDVAQTRTNSVAYRE